MSISKAKILGSFIEYPLPEKQLTKEVLNLSELLLSKESLHPSITSEKIEISEIYIPSTNDNWRGQNYNNNNKNDFKRGHNYQNKEDLITIDIQNIYSFNDNTNIPKDKESFYLKDHYQNIIGPISSDNLIEMYKEKKIDSSFFFRPIDIYSFKEYPLFYFLPLSTLNEKDWSYKIMDNPLLQYTELFKTTQKLFELPSKKTQEKKIENIKKDDIKEKDDLTEEKEKEDIKEDKKVKQKKIPTMSKQDTYIKEEEDGEWEDPNKRKRKVRPQKKEKNENKQIPIGLKVSKNDIKINSANTIIKNNPNSNNNTTNNPNSNNNTTNNTNNNNNNNNSNDNNNISNDNNNNNNTNDNNNNSDDLLEMLRPKKQNQKEEKPMNIEDYYDDNEEYRNSYQGGKNRKKKKRPHQANNNINLGFKY